MQLRRVVSALFVFALHCTLRAAPATLVHDSVIDPLAHNFPTASYSVPTVHGVTFQQDGVTTYKGWQYAAYYQGTFSNGYGKLAIARRPLPHGSWQTLVFNDYSFTTVDSHNDVVLGICAGDGSIHLSFDHHGVPLKYRVSTAGLADNPTTTAWTAAQFGPITDRLISGSASMTAVTYPRFIPTPSGKLLFTYRFGGSGGGDEILYEYNGLTSTWALIGQYTTRAGSYTGSFGTSSDRNSYFDNTIYDSNGRLHATWCWRETPDAGSNHDLLYSYSDDSGRTWKNQLGATISVAGTSFISVNSPGIIGWPIPQKRNYINNSAMTVDSKGRVHVVAWMLPSSLPDQTTFSTSLSSGSRFIHYWRGTDGVWRKNETILTGSRAKLSADDDGRLFLIYGNATNLQIATASPSSNPETSPANSWNNWTPMELSAALPAGKANTVNIINDTARWDADRIISIYAQETNISGAGPTPLHILDYHVSNAAVLPAPLDGSRIDGLSPALAWTSGQSATQHDVYLGTRQTAVSSATSSSAEFLGRQSTTTIQQEELLQNTTYFWRVDSVDASGAITPGRVWSFSTGSAAPIVSNGESSRGPGTSVTFRGSLFLPISDPTEVTLFWGNSDAGETAAAWQNSTSLGTRPGGPVDINVSSTTSAAIYYRFRATNLHGQSWSSVAGTLPTLLPSITQSTGTRSYGGRVTFSINVDLKDPSISTGNVSIFFGASDGGDNPAAWQSSANFPDTPAGNNTLTVDRMPAESLYVRFRVTSIHGTAWSNQTQTLASAEDLSSWKHTALLATNNYTVAQALTNFPILFRLSPASVPGFAYSQIQSPPHGDLRFSNESGTVLAHQVETWDPLGTSLIWIKIPELTAATRLRIWWGKSAQSTPPSSSTWSEFSGVWHLDQTLGFGNDSSPNGLVSVSSATTSAAGIIPGAAGFNGTTSSVAINNTAAINPSLITVEAWVKPASTGTVSIFGKDQTNGGTNRVWQFRLVAGKPELIVFNNANANGGAASPDSILDGQYHHLAGTWDGINVRIYVDGTLKNTSPFAGTLRTGQSNKAFIGRSENTSPGYISGSIDEVRLSSSARSSDWIRASWDSQKPNSTFITALPSSIPDLDLDKLPDAWEMQHFQTTHLTSQDPDSDGSSNLLEYALGTDPASGADSPQQTVISGSAAEFIYQQLAGGTGSVGTTYTAAGIRYVVELSDDLITWQSGQAFLSWSGRREPLPGGMERVGIHITNPLTIHSQRTFARLQAIAVD